MSARVQYYRPTNCMRVPEVTIIHTEALGKRYNEKVKGGGADRAQYRINELKRDKVTLKRQVLQIYTIIYHTQNLGLSVYHLKRHQL